EALARGIPILSYDRGCICSQVQSFGATLPQGNDFVPFAIEWLKRYLALPKELAQLKAEARASYEQEYAAATRKAAEMFGAAACPTPVVTGPVRIDIWHNILWSSYKGEVFSALHAYADNNKFTVRFFQIAETEGNRVALSGVDLTHHRYPYRLLFKGS